MTCKSKLLNAIILFLTFLLVLSLPAIAHSGRTDSSGGHYNRSTGEYHYHHGYPAHSHSGGVCPYEFDDQTDHTSGTSSSDHSDDLPAVETPSQKNETDSDTHESAGDSSSTEMLLEKEDEKITEDSSNDEPLTFDSVVEKTENESIDNSQSENTDPTHNDENNEQTTIDENAEQTNDDENTEQTNNNKSKLNLGSLFILALFIIALVFVFIKNL